ncbi:armadillo-type protein [Globomyces pollinis-pini]|nr:armadillo-type protein [Globomyces pollinis-pini]
MTISVPEQQKIHLDEKGYNDLSAILLNKNESLAKRFRTLFTLKAVNTMEAINIISEAFVDDSALLKHELAYVLGQMKNPLALPTLYKILADLNQEPMVRHESAEAIAAIGLLESLDFLKKYEQDESVVVKETVGLAIAKLLHDNSTKEEVESQKIYSSIDPAPPTKEILSTEELKERLNCTTLPLFERYRAMFALRNKGDTDSVLALASGFQDESALFRHEIAYVFGQLQHPASVPSLIETLSNTNELSMVRHEAAEALGSIATPECFPCLRQFSEDPDKTVRDSCIVGLDMYEYEVSGDFQYATKIEIEK